MKTILFWDSHCSIWEAFAIKKDLTFTDLRKNWCMWTFLSIIKTELWDILWQKKSRQQNLKFSALGIDLTLLFSRQRLKKEYFKDRLTKHGTAVVLTKLSKDSSFSLSFRRKFQLQHNKMGQTIPKTEFKKFEMVTFF